MFAVYDGHGGKFDSNLQFIAWQQPFFCFFRTLRLLCFSFPLGEEVALYCSKYLPDIIKEQKTYKDGKLQKVMLSPDPVENPALNHYLLTLVSFACCFKALEDAFLAIDSRITTEDVIKELVQIAGRPTEEPPSEKMAEEDDCK